MRLKVFIGTALCASVAALASQALAQGDPPSDATRRPSGSTAGEPPTTPPSSDDTPLETVPKDATPSPAPERAAGEGTGAGNAPSPESPSTDVGASDEGTSRAGPIGATLSPLLVTAGLGYAYAAVTHPELTSRSLSGPFVEVAFGTELEPRFRLSLSFTSFETKLRRTRTGQWEEGEYRAGASGLHALKDPIEPTERQSGGAVVQKAFHAHSLGPRMDFLPLGSQGPYLGMTVAVAIIQDVATRVGGAVAARVGGEWRPFHSLGLGIEAGAHGQIYADSKAAIPYALARLTLLLEPGNLRGGGGITNPSKLIMPRTLPAPTPR
ncbi:MAG TPA: hypothetical protein VK540_31915 [Polyangiaceae bacterium]|nr:hypothetical protein [Polyangiaceae bacterium]